MLQIRENMLGLSVERAKVPCILEPVMWCDVSSKETWHKDIWQQARDYSSLQEEASSGPPGCKAPRHATMVTHLEGLRVGTATVAVLVLLAMDDEACVPFPPLASARLCAPAHPGPVADPND